MGKWLTVLAVACLLAVGSVATADERIAEAGRSRFGTLRGDLFGVRGTPDGLVVNPADGTAWLIEGGTVSHLSPTGELLARSVALPAPQRLALDQADGSCWALGGPDGELLHLSENAVLLSTTGRYDLQSALSPSPADGSAWVTGPDSAPDPTAIAHVNAAGVELAHWIGRSFPVVVDPTDATAWRQEGSAVVCLNANGTERWRVSDLGADLCAVENTSDQTLWVGTDTGRLLHLAGTDGHTLFETTFVQRIARLFCYAGDGSIWANHTGAAAPAGSLYPYTAHYDAAGAQLWSQQGETLALGQSDGATLGWAYGQVASTALELRSNAHALLGTWDLVEDNAPWYPWAFDPTGHSLWLRACACATPSHLLNLAATGEVISDVEVLSLGSVGRYMFPLTWPGPTFWVDQSDGTCWAIDANATALYHLSAQAELLASTPTPPVISGPIPPHGVLFNPADRTWWVLSVDVANPSDTGALLHLSLDGSELARCEGLGTNAYASSMEISPLDGTLWVMTYGWVYQTHGFGPNAQLWHFAADGTALGEQGFPVSMGTAPLLADGSRWVYATDYLTSSLVHFTPAGEVDQTIPLAAGLRLGSLRVDPDSGAFYALNWVYDGLTDVSYAHLTKLSPTGEVLWQKPQALVSAALDRAADGTLWVTEYGTWAYEANAGSALYHLDADGSELSRDATLNGPTSPVAVPGDSSVWLADTGNLQLVHAAGERSIFPDVPFSFWAYDAIGACVQAGIVTGYQDGTYQPKHEVNRGQMAAFIARAMCGGEAFVPTGPAEASFADVPVDAPFFRHIEYAHAQGVVTGYKYGTYHPEWAVNRGQMAAFLARAQCGGDAFVPSGPATASFTDVPTDFGFYRYIEYLHTAGLTTGYSDGTYHPEWVCNRDQMAVFVARAFHLLP